MSEIINIPDEPIPGIKQTLSVFQMAEDAVASYTTVKKAYGYKNTLLGKLRSQRDTNPSVCDMVICIDNHKFPVHKCLMIVSSDYFEAMLRSGMQEARSNVIELKGISAKSLQVVIDFIYTGELRLSINNIAELIRAVSHLQVKYALRLCEEFLIEETTTDNCIEILQLAEVFSIKKVKSTVNLYILRNFDKLIFNEKYKKLTRDQFASFLQSNKLNLFPEIRVFSACVNYIQSYHEHHNYADTSLTYHLMQFVRFHTMKPEEFVDIVTKNPLIKSDKACSQLVIEAYEYFALPNRQYCSSSARSMVRNEQAMVCVNESMYMLNKREDIWQYLCQSPATCKTLSQKFAVVNNFLYACGGYSEQSRETCNKCHRFDPRTGTWTQIASMTEKRQFFTLAACSEFIVAVGGVYGNVGNFYATNPVTSPLEYYSIEKNMWTSLKRCQVPILKWPGACIFNEEGGMGNKVFIVGGKLTGPNHSLSQESFIVDLKTSEVVLCPPPVTTRFNPSVFYERTENKIILFAGEDEKYRLAPCIETFDLTSRQWTEIATIPVSLSYQCISSTSMVNKRIFYLLEEHDGPSSESYILKSACFDIDTWQFEAPKQLPHPSTLASKWCTLVFPREFLSKYQTLSSCDETDLNISFEHQQIAVIKRTSTTLNEETSQARSSQSSDRTLSSTSIDRVSCLQQPQLVIDEFSRASARQKSKRRSKSYFSNSGSSGSRMTKSSKEKMSKLISSLNVGDNLSVTDVDLTNFELLSLNNKKFSDGLGESKGTVVTGKRRTKSNSSVGVFKSDLEKNAKMSISSSSTNSMYTSGEDLSEG